MSETSGHASIITTMQEAPTSVWVLIVGTFINKLGSFLQIFLVLYLITRGFSAWQAGLALGGYGAGSIVGVITGGSVTDRLGYRWTIIGSMIASCLLTISIVYVANFLLILIIATLIGAVAQAYRPAASVLLTSLTPQDRHTMIFAAYRLAFNLGMTAGPLLGALLANGSYALLFWSDAITSLLFALVAIFALPGGKATAQEKQAEVSKGSYLQVFADRRYVLFLVALFLNAVVYIQYLTVLPLHINALKLPIGVYSVLVSLNAVIVIVCEIPITHIVQRFSMRRAVALGIGLIGIGLNLYVIPAGIVVLLIGTIVWSLGECIGTPAASAYPARVAPPQLRGRYLAASAAPQSLGYALGPVIGTTIWMWLGSGAWWLCGLITVFAVIATLQGIKQVPDKEAAKVVAETI